MKTSTLISVIIPYYDPKGGLYKDSILSILAQSYKNWELIIVNDGSNADNTNKTANFIKDINDKRILLINLKKNLGVSAAKNIGIKNATGKLITFLDIDDIYFPWHLGDINNSFENNSELLILNTANVSYVRIGKLIKKLHCFINRKKILCTEIFYLKDDYSNLFSFPRIALRKEVFDIVRFDENMTTTEDTDLLLQIVNNPDLLNKIGTLSRPGYLYRMYPSKERLTHNIKSVFENRNKIIHKYKTTNTNAFKVLSLWKERYSYWYFKESLYHYLNNGSFIDFSRDVFSSSLNYSTRCKGLNAFIYTALNEKLLTPVFGINLRYLDILFDRKNNKFDLFKNIYKDYMKNIQDNDIKSYQGIIFNKIFEN